MPECGEKYANLIRTDSGLTPGDPCGLVCSNLDYEEWQSAAEVRVLRAVGLHWSHLAAEAAKQDREQILEDLAVEHSAYRKGFTELPIYWWSIDWARPFESYKAAVLRVIQNMREGACLLERIDEGLAELGAKIPAIPSTPKEPGSVWDYLKIAGLLTIAGVGTFYAGRYLLARHTLRVKESTTAELRSEET